MDNTPPVCKDCIKWSQHGKNCWVFWELKKECTLHETELNGF